MSVASHKRWMTLLPAAAIAAVVSAPVIYSQADMPPTNDAPNPYQTIENHFKMPAGRTWGSTSAVEIAPDGKSIWVAERCGANLCLDRATNTMSQLPSVLRFDLNGNLMTSFGAGMIVFPHGIFVDRQGNVWVTDGNDNAPAPARGGGAGGRGGAAAGGGAPAGGGRAAAGGGGAPAGGGGAAAGGGRQGGGAAAGGGRGAGPTGPNPAATIGHQVFKFSPEGKLLMTIGRAGGATGEGQCCWQPNDIAIGPDNNIYIAEGHGGNPNDRIMIFTPEGKFIRAFGSRGDGPGQFNQPHALAFDSQGRLFVGDRGNNRVQIFDKNMNHVATWYQFSRPSGLFIDRNDMLYSADSESGSVNPAHGAWKRGIRIGSVKDGKVIAFIPDPSGEGVTFNMVDGKPVLTRADGTPGPGGTLAAEGVAVDPQGVIYGAEVGPRKLQRYIRK